MTNNLQVRNFPVEVNKALKKLAVDKGITFGKLVTDILTAAAQKAKA